MSKIQTFIENGKFFKGNIHSHTIHSDGNWTPQQSVENHQREGYDFMAITDHNIYGNYQSLNQENFLILPGFEGNVILPRNDLRQFHIVYLEDQPSGFEHHKRIKAPSVSNLNQVNEYIKKMTDAGFMAILAHPTWSLTPYDQVKELKGISMMEVYNTGCDKYENLGSDYHIWQTLLRDGNHLWGVAVDDNHNEDQDIYSDSFGGWICVKAKTLSQTDIISALKQGSFYASSGPVVNEYYIENNIVNISCEHVTKIFINDQQRNYYVHINPDIKTYHFDISNWNADFILVTLVDEQGRKAHLNPIYLK